MNCRDARYEELLVSLQQCADNDSMDDDLAYLILLQFLNKTCPETPAEQDSRLGVMLRDGFISPAVVARVLDDRVRFGMICKVRDTYLAKLLRQDGVAPPQAVRLLFGQRSMEALSGRRSVRSRLCHGSPSAPVIRSLCETLLVITTLLLGFNQTNYRMLVPSLLQAVDLTWEGWCANVKYNVTLASKGWCDEPPSRTLFSRSIWCFAVLAMALLMAITTYLSMIFAQLPQVDASTRESWWNLFRIPLGLSYVMWAAGMFTMCWTNSIAVRMYYDDVDRLVEEQAGTSVWERVQAVQWIILGAGAGAVVLNAVLSLVWQRIYQARRQKRPPVQLRRRIDTPSARAQHFPGNTSENTEIVVSIADDSIDVERIESPVASKPRDGSTSEPGDQGSKTRIVNVTSAEEPEPQQNSTSVEMVETRKTC